MVWGAPGPKEKGPGQGEKEEELRRWEGQRAAGLASESAARG